MDRNDDGERLSDEARIALERLLGADLTAVRVHQGRGAAAILFATGRRPRRLLMPALQVRTREPLFAVQCLMPVAEFKTATKASGPRNKIKSVDTQLTNFHALDAKTPRDYVAAARNSRTRRVAGA